MKLETAWGKIDINDYEFIRKRYGEPDYAIPCPITKHKKGKNKGKPKINPHETRFFFGDKIVSVFHIKPIYYLHQNGQWRPMSEVASGFGNTWIHLKEDWDSKMDLRYLRWLMKRMEIVKARLGVCVPIEKSVLVEKSSSIQREKVLVPLKEGETIMLTTDTFYPDPDPESTSVDGFVQYDTGNPPSSSQWDTAHDATSGTTVADNTTSSAYQCGFLLDALNNHTLIGRTFLLFDTSSLPDNTTISSATISVYSVGAIVRDAVNDGYDFITVVQSSPASNTALVLDDYDKCGAVNNPTEGIDNADRLDLSTVNSSSSWYDFPLNSTGISWISKTGVSKFGMREGHDVLDIYPGTPGTYYNNLLEFALADTAGTTQDPKLVVVHTPPVTEVTVSKELASAIEEISIDKDIIIKESGVGTDKALRDLEIRITDYGIGKDDAYKGKTVVITESGIGRDEVTVTKKIYEKNIHINVYSPEGEFLKAWKDATFVGFTKEINGGLGECVIKLARKFDDYGEYFDVKLNNEVQIKITDKDTANTADKEKLIYSGYISKYEPWVEGGKEGVTVTLLGYYTKFAQDIYKNGTTTTITETATDVGQMFRNLMDRYRAETSNPKLNYSNESIEETGTTATYTFEMMTYREAIDVIKSLAPANWWWYVDQENIVHFKPKPSSATHTFIFGRHFRSVRIEKGMEKIKNALLFWNSKTGDGQVYRLYDDDGSISDYGRRVLKYIDPGRIGDTVDADKIAQGFISEHKDPDVKVVVEIMDNNYDPLRGYDIESIEPGHTCSFAGFSETLSETFEENMLITKVEYYLDRVRLTIEPMKAGIVDRVEKIAREIGDISTKDAPTSYNE